MSSYFQKLMGVDLINDTSIICNISCLTIKVIIINKKEVSNEQT